MWDLLDKEYSAKLGFRLTGTKNLREKVPLGRGCTVEMWQIWQFFLLLHSPTYDWSSN
jgi:hypothetical protein